MQSKVRVLGVISSMILFLGANGLLAGPATAPYVKGELLVAFQEPPVAKDQALIYGSRQTLQGLQAKGMLKEEGAHLLSSAGATGLKAVVRQPASDLKPGRSPQDWHQVYRVSFRKDSPVFKSRASMRKFCETLSAEPGIEYAEPNYVGSLTAVPNDPVYPNQQQATFTQYGLETAWDVETGSPEII